MRRNEPNPDRTMSALDHLGELRRRFIASLLAFAACFLLALVFYDELIGLFTSRFARIEPALGAELFANSIAEGFLVQLQASAIAALIVSLPFHLVNACLFLFPAFQARTRAVVSAGLVASFLLALAGAYLAYFRIIPFSIKFLTGSRFIPRGVAVLLNYQKSVSYVMAFLLWTVITFQAPIALEILLSLDLLKRKSVFRASRYIVIGVFALAAAITPSVDPISQCAIALPLIVLYFLVLLVAKVLGLGEGREGRLEGEAGRE